jgi:hypothetical protein
VGKALASPFDHPEAQKLLTELGSMLGRESDRGLVLVGAAHIDTCLADLLHAVFPSSMERDFRKRLLKYPGPLASLAARADAAFAFRLIPREVYEAINALRELRNELAHKPAAFTLVGQEERYFRIYAIGPDVPNGIRRMAFEIMLQAKLRAVTEVMENFRKQNPEFAHEAWNDKRILDRITSDTNIMKAFEQQLPHWELVIGIALLGSMIIFHREHSVVALGDAKSLGDLVASADRVHRGAQDA